MARLRLATVEERHCDQCGKHYAGRHCPTCSAAATVLTPRETRSLLIVLDPFCPRYERCERWRCPSCKSLYEPPAIDPVFARVSRCQCGTSVVDRSMIDGEPTRLAKARRLVAEIKRRKNCPGCDLALPAPCWCPVCEAKELAATSPLPLRPTWIYVPTGNRSVALDDVRGGLVDPTSEGRPTHWQGVPIEHDTVHYEAEDRKRGSGE